MLETGGPAPDFTLPDQDGSSVTLGELRGRWVVLYFYPKAATPGCAIEGRCFRDLSGDFADAGIEILGISFDTPAQNAAFRRDEGFGFRLLCDTEKTTGAAYDAVRGPDEDFAGFPRRLTYVIDPDGKIAFVYDVGADIDAHPARVLADITAAAAPS